MIRPILACVDPYKAAEEFSAAGWKIDFLSPWRAAILWLEYRFAAILFYWVSPRVMLRLTSCHISVAVLKFA